VVVELIPAGLLLLSDEEKKFYGAIDGERRMGWNN
jgi:hypothetical protein